LIEGDAVVGTLLDALEHLGLKDNTMVVFASDNGPQGEVVRELGGDMPDMGSPGPFRGELGDVSEGSLRTAAIIRWPGHIKPGQSYAMCSIMDFFPTFVRLAGGKVPHDHPIDGVDQTDLWLGKSATGARDHLLVSLRRRNNGMSWLAELRFRVAVRKGCRSAVVGCAWVCLVVLHGPFGWQGIPD
jgi:arylsulfatase